MIDRLVHHAEVVPLRGDLLPTQEPRPRPNTNSKQRGPMTNQGVNFQLGGFYRPALPTTDQFSVAVDIGEHFKPLALGLRSMTRSCPGYSGMSPITKAGPHGSWPGAGWTSRPKGISLEIRRAGT
jgi:hypothetical protein